jgi:uncharacterized OsmC-like protein
MDQQDIASNIARARTYLRSLPAMAQSHDVPAVATVARDLVMKVSGPAGMPDGMVAGIGDTAAVPSPGWYFRAALASQVAMFVTMRAAEEDAQLDDLEVTVNAESDDRGALGMDEEIPAGPLSMSITVRYSRSSVDEDTTRRLIEWAISHTPIHDAVTRAVPVTFTIEKGAQAADESLPMPH